MYKASNWFGFSLGDSYSVVATLNRAGGLGLAVGSVCACVLGSAGRLLGLRQLPSSPGKH